MYTGFGQQLGIVEPFAGDCRCTEFGRVVVAIGRRRGSKPEEPGSATRFGRTMVAHTTQCNRCNPYDGQLVTSLFHPEVSDTLSGWRGRWGSTPDWLRALS